MPRQGIRTAGVSPALLISLFGLLLLPVIPRAVFGPRNLSSAARHWRIPKFPRRAFRRQRQSKRALQRRAHRDRTQVRVCEIREHPAKFSDRRPHRAHNVNSLGHVRSDVSTALHASMTPAVPKPRPVNPRSSRSSVPAQTAGRAHNFHGFSTPRASVFPTRPNPKPNNYSYLRNDVSIGRTVATLLMRSTHKDSIRGGIDEEVSDEKWGSYSRSS